MERFGGSRSPRSGAGWSRKNDGRTDIELIEFKRTDNRRSITLKYDDLDGLYRHAVAESRLPVLVFELRGECFVVLRESDYHELVLHRQQPDPSGDLRADAPSVARFRKVQRATGRTLLRRIPPQQQPGPGGQERLLGHTPGPPRPLPGPGGLSRSRYRQRGEVRSLGRNQRKGASPDKTPEAS